MKKILCYGDSNTFGYNPFDGSRFDAQTRWTALLQNKLCGNYEITEDGACGRTGFVDNDEGFLFSAQRHFPEIIAKEKGTDILILAIGTNDLQFKYDVNFDQIENGLNKLIFTAKNHVKRIILVPPVILNNDVLKGNFNYQFDKTSISKSKKAGEIYKRISGLELFDFNEFVRPSSKDGLHYDEAGHKVIAEKLSSYINF